MDNTSWAIKDTYQRLWGNDDIFQLLANDIKNGHKLTWDSKIYWRKGSCLKFCSFYLLEERIQGLVKYLPGEGIASRNSPPSIWAGQRHARIWLERIYAPSIGGMRGSVWKIGINEITMTEKLNYGFHLGKLIIVVIVLQSLLSIWIICWWKNKWKMTIIEDQIYVLPEKNTTNVSLSIQTQRRKSNFRG